MDSITLVPRYNNVIQKCLKKGVTEKMEIGIRLNVGTGILLGVITGLSYNLYIKKQKINLLVEENKILKEMKGETRM